MAKTHPASHGHLYKFGAKKRQEKSFEERYGKRKGKEVYGAVVGIVKREREAKKGKGRHRTHMDDIHL